MANRRKNVLSLNKLRQSCRDRSMNTYLKHKADAEAQAAQYIDLRAYPRPGLDAITFPLQSPELTNFFIEIDGDIGKQFFFP